MRARCSFCHRDITVEDNLGPCLAQHLAADRRGLCAGSGSDAPVVDCGTATFERQPVDVVVEPWESSCDETLLEMLHASLRLRGAA